MYIPAEAYLQEDWLRREMHSWFADRVFVDVAPALAAEGAWRAFALGDQQLVVRQTANGLRAHDNVCLHRSAQLLPNGRGQGPLRCSYHGWRYDDDGCLASTPMLVRPEVERSQLVAYPVAEQAGLVWMFPSQQAAVEQDAVSLLNGFDVAAAKPFHHADLDHNANWKLLVENVVESYHLSYVHRDSFVPTGLTTTSAVSHGVNPSGSWAYTEPRADPSKPTRRTLAGATAGYRHAYLFPNVFLSLTNELVLFVSHFHPVSATATRLEYTLLASPLLQAQSAAVMEHVQAESIAFTDRVLREDLTILEASQRGMAAVKKRHQLQTVEPRVMHFHEHYRTRLSC